VKNIKFTIILFYIECNKWLKISWLAVAPYNPIFKKVNYKNDNNFKNYGFQNILSTTKDRKMNGKYVSGYIKPTK